jgi:hypothetical protein
MVFDPLRGKVLLFGGWDGRNYLGDTWEWDGVYWVQVADTGPSPRCLHGLAYDPAGQRILLFGGVGATDDTRPGAASEMFGDTWEWKDEQWTQLEDTGPEKRAAFAMTTDPKRQRVILFGGQPTIPSNMKFFGDTWEWDGNSWTQREDVGPRARGLVEASWDAVGERILLFGGMGSGLGTPGPVLPVFSDTWAWDGNQWKQVADIGPRARAGHAMASDGKRVLLFGGQSLLIDAPTGMASGVQMEGDTWAWSGSRWVKIQDIGPAPRWDHALAFDDVRHTFVLFGGSESHSGDFSLVKSGFFGDTWEPSDRAAVNPGGNP